MASRKPNIDATVAGTASTSYVGFKFANDYFAQLLSHEQWVSFEEADRKRALNSATAKIDNIFRTVGAAFEKFDTVDPEQALVFPRVGDRNDSGSLEIMDDIEDATCLLALHMLEEMSGGDPMSVAAMQDAGVQAQSAGGVATTTKARRYTNLPLEVENLISPYIRRGGRTIAGRTTEPKRWHAGWIGH